MQCNSRIRKLLIVGATVLAALDLVSSAAAGPIQLLKDLKPGFWENDTREVLQVQTTSETAVVVSKRRAGMYSEVDFQLNLLNGLESHFEYGYPLGQGDNFPYPTSHDMAQHPFFAMRNEKVIFPFSVTRSPLSRFVEVDGVTGELVHLTGEMEETPFATWNCADGKVGFVQRSHASKSWEICRFDSEIYDSIEVTTSVPYAIPTASYWPTLGPVCVLDDVLFFTAVEDDGKYVSLYRTDGTSSGTKTVYAGPMDNFGLLKALGKCFFGVSKPSEPNQALYVTDANADEATLLAEDLGGILSPFHRYQYTESGSTVYWLDFPSNRIFASDGMTTRILPLSAQPNDYPSSIVWAGNNLYINMSTWNYPGTSLYKSDGFSTPTEVHSGNSPFADIFAAAETTSGTFIYCSNAIYFGTGDLSNTTLVSQDYSSEKSDRPAVWPFKDRVIYTRSTGSSSMESDQLFAQNPTDAYAPKQLTNFTQNPVNGDPGEFLKVGNRIFFTDTIIEDSNFERASFSSDGSTAGTYNIFANRAKWLGGSAQGALFYSNYRHWDDGQYNGDGMVYAANGVFNAPPKEIISASGSVGVRTEPTPLLDKNGICFFGGGYYNLYPMLLRSDGTPAGTTELIFNTSEDLRYPLQPIGFAGDRAVFFASAVEPLGEKFSIWSTDGTQDGTLKIAESVTTPTEGAVLPNGKLLFGASVNGFGHELLVTDGTSDGTTLTADIINGPNGSSAHNFIRSGEKVFFVANDATSNDSTLLRLGFTDGTPGGTIQIPGNLNSFPGNHTVTLAASQHKGVYVRASDERTVTLLYCDGSAEGPRELLSGAVSSDPQLVAEVNGFMYLALTTPDLGRELYRTAGHSGGVELVQDFAPGKASGAVMKDAAVLGNRLMFAADARDGYIGRELYYIDVMDSGVADWQLY